MKHQGQSAFGDCHRTTDVAISRRAAVGSAGLAILGLLSGSVLGQEEKKEPQRKGAEGGSFKTGQERMEEFIARLDDLALEFASARRGGDTVYGLLLAAYPTNLPTLKDASDEH